MIELSNIVIPLAKQKGLFISLVLIESAENFLLGQNATQLMLNRLIGYQTSMAPTLMRMNGTSHKFRAEAF